MDRFFQNAFDTMPEEAKESFFKTVFLNDDSEYAAQVRLEYYSKKLRHLGKNVTIGAGVKFINPQYISLGDNVQLSDHVTLIARGPVSVGIATAGAAPVLAGLLRQRVEEALPENLEDVFTAAAALTAELRRTVPAPAERTRLLRSELERLLK